MIPQERLREIIDFLKKEHNLTNGKLSLALEYRSETYVSDILGGSKNAGKLFLARMKKHFRVNPDYIQKGKLPKIFDIDKSSPPAKEMKNLGTGESGKGQDYMKSRLDMKNAYSPHMAAFVPVRAQAGYARSYNNTDFLDQLELYPILPGIDPRGAIWRYFEVQGDSMEPGLYDTDLVLVSIVPQEDWRDIKKGQVYVLVMNEEVLIKLIGNYIPVGTRDGLNPPASYTLSLI